MTTNLARIRLAPTAAARRSEPAPVGRVNVAFAWVSIALSMVGGSIVGLWAFDGPFPAPAGFADYDSLPRRLMRLAHVAAIALPVLNLLYVQCLASGVWGRRARELGCRLLLVGTILLPLVLSAAAFWPPAKLLLPLPVASLIAAMALQAVAQLRGCFEGGPR